ncbi:hypothetical protein Pen01_43920 [Phytomonospora endophytica]|nr:hypothetical protein Pen01_43920 [Phytomonospora endophytica]
MLIVNTRKFPQVRNEHDPLAVGVYVGGERLAYIPKDHARKLQPRILPCTSRGVAVTVPVAVSRVKDGGTCGVHVVMDEPA